MESLDWSFFAGKTYCMTLRSTPIRRDHAYRQFKRVNLHNIVEFIEFDKDPEGSRVGTWHGHVALLRRAYEAGHDFALIFEDDIVFDERHLSQRALNDCVRFIETRPFDLFFLGHIPWWSERTADPSILHVRSVMLHAYVASRDWIRWVLDHMPASIDKDVTVIDDYFCYNAMRAYAINPMFCYQRDDDVIVSEHHWGTLGEIRRACDRHHERWVNEWTDFLSDRGPFLPIHLTKFAVAAFALFYKTWTLVSGPRRKWADAAAIRAPQALKGGNARPQNL